MNQILTTDDGETVEVPTCRHHWKIAPPNGATSQGVCKLCGETREFRNSSTDSIWENDSGESGFNRGRRNAQPAIEDDVRPRRPALGSLLGRRFTEES